MKMVKVINIRIMFQFSPVYLPNQGGGGAVVKIAIPL